MTRKSAIENLFKLGQAAAEAGNHKEAYGYFTRVLEADPDDADAWFGKGVAAGWLSNLRGDRLTEMTVGIERAMRSDDGRERFAKRTALDVADVIASFFALSLGHTKEFLTVDSSWPEHIDRCLAMIEALKKTLVCVPTAKNLLEQRLEIVDSLLTGMEYQEDDEGHYRYLHVSDELKASLQQDHVTVVEKIKALDPSFVPAEVKPVAGPSCGCQIVVGSVFLLIALAVIVYLLKLMNS